MLNKKAQIQRINKAIIDCPTEGCENKYLPYDNKLSPEDREAAVNAVYLLPALSRRDNETYICSACGVREAIEDYEEATKHG